MQAGFTAEHYASGALKKLLASPTGAVVAPVPEDAVLATSSSGAVPQQQVAPAGKAEKVSFLRYTALTASIQLSIRASFEIVLASMLSQLP
jgi:hypothetical protein